MIVNVVTTHSPRVRRWIEDAQTQAGLTDADVAKAIGVSPSHWSDAKAGIRPLDLHRFPSAPTEFIRALLVLADRSYGVTTLRDLVDWLDAAIRGDKKMARATLDKGEPCVNPTRKSSAA